MKAGKGIVALCDDAPQTDDVRRHGLSGGATSSRPSADMTFGDLAEDHASDLAADGPVTDAAVDGGCVDPHTQRILDGLEAVLAAPACGPASPVRQRRPLKGAVVALAGLASLAVVVSQCASNRAVDTPSAVDSSHAPPPAARQLVSRPTIESASDAPSELPEVATTELAVRAATGAIAFAVFVDATDSEPVTPAEPAPAPPAAAEPQPLFTLPIRDLFVGGTDTLGAGAAAAFGTVRTTLLGASQPIVIALAPGDAPSPADQRLAQRRLARIVDTLHFLGIDRSLLKVSMTSAGDPSVVLFEQGGIEK